MEDYSFLGVSPDNLLGLGAITVAAGRLEGLGVDLALELGGDAREKSFTNIIREVRSLVGAELPGGSLVTADEILAWCDQALSAMDNRNSGLHSTFFYRLSEDGQIETRRSHRDRAEQTLRSSASWALARRLAALNEEGSQLFLAIMPMPKDRVYVRTRFYEGDSWIIVNHGQDPDFPRPTEAEADAWWNTYQPREVK